jgi:hypothetical protein
MCAMTDKQTARLPSQWRNMNPEAVAEGSHAQVIYCIRDAQHDIVALLSEVDRLSSEVAVLRSSVIAFCAPFAVRYAAEFGCPPEYLHPTHYDILARAGAKMDDFVRGEEDAQKGWR